MLEPLKNQPAPPNAMSDEAMTTTNPNYEGGFPSNASTNKDLAKSIHNMNQPNMEMI